MLNGSVQAHDSKATGPLSGGDSTHHAVVYLSNTSPTSNPALQHRRPGSNQSKLIARCPRHDLATDCFQSSTDTIPHQHAGTKHRGQWSTHQLRPHGEGDKTRA
ncbi:unnamed protein product [Caenorhabditis nigoni]